jgi:hypothetical protein
VHQAIDEWNSKVPNIKLQEITTDNNTPNADVKYRFSIDMASLKSSRMAWQTIAIQEQLEGNMADWMEKVSDEQYRITKINYKNLVIMKSNNFKGKVAFVTGAASGIGRATAIAFALEGARVAVTDISEQRSHETTNIIKEAGGRALAVKCDVSQTEDVKNCLGQAIETFGRLDFAFNNAGVEQKLH